ncbi:hypothetical protein LCGC14_2312250 [marine sediment metagenome]|uniref:Uncharacterized protein n=1 Tax=marine sediment metagenome TaxID=412755 RepID=A0A0F9FF86_9ZZZZ
MEEPPLTPEELEELEEMQDEAADDAQEDQLLNTKEFQDAYGSPEPEEKQNQHSFLHKAAFDSLDTLRVTNLNEFELGRPMFNVRFLLDMEDIAKFYLDEMAKILNVPNKVAEYFHDKISNITDSGMSKDGFTANLNVTKKMDTIRKKVRVNPIENLQGGKKRR